MVRWEKSGARLPRRVRGCGMERTNIAKLCEIIDNDAFIYRIMKRCPYEVLKHIAIRRIPAGRVVLRRGETCDRFYIILSGRLAIYAMSDNGKEFTLTTYQRGMYLGELEILQSKPCVSSVQTVTAVSLLEVARADYLLWLETDQNFSRYILQTLCETMYALSETTTRNSLYTLKRRVYAYLADHAAETNGRRGVPISAKALADLMGVTTRSVNRVLKELKDREVIEPQGRQILIHDIAYLHNAGDCSPGERTRTNSINSGGNHHEPTI